MYTFFLWNNWVTYGCQGVGLIFKVLEWKKMFSHIVFLTQLLGHKWKQLSNKDSQTEQREQAAALVPGVTLELAGSRCFPAPVGRLPLDSPRLGLSSWCCPQNSQVSEITVFERHHSKWPVFYWRYLKAKTKQKNTQKNLRMTTEDKLGGSPTMWHMHTHSTLFLFSFCPSPENFLLDRHWPTARG